MCIRDSPYTSPSVAIPKKNRQVRLCLDAREINKMIVNDRTSPGEVEEILKRFYGTKSVSYTHLDVYKRQVVSHRAFTKGSSKS